MLKVVAVVDKKRTALDRLARGVTKYHDNLLYFVADVHPKRPDTHQLQYFEAVAEDADIIDWQYFKTAEMLREKYPWLEGKKHILTHNNPYSIFDKDWNNYDLNIGNNQYIYKQLGKITERPTEYVPLTVDTDFWTFNTDWKVSETAESWKRPDKTNSGHNSVIMVANRIESKKGILPVAIACAELNLRFTLVGAVSDPNYLYDIKQTGVVDFHEQVSDEELRDLYHKSLIHVCNSVDNFESGTLPMLEAMLCGVPVLTRNVGHVPELNNGENMVILDSDPEDVESITNKLREMISDKKRLTEMRDKGWQTAKSRSHERRAYMYQKLYRQVLHTDSVPVSIVVPVYDKPDIIRKCLNAIANQTYKNIEVIVADDSLQGESQSLVLDFAKFVSIPVRYMNTAEVMVGDVDYVKDYGLARGRNKATIEATGDVIVYCDQRMIMEPDAVAEFVKKLKPRYWLYGNKGSRKEFVENFSCVYRKDVINAGMFCERMDAYGGLSQETRARIRNQGIQTEYVETAKAIPTGKSGNRNQKRQEIIKMKNRLWKMELE